MDTNLSNHEKRIEKEMADEIKTMDQAVKAMTKRE